MKYNCKTKIEDIAKRQCSKSVDGWFCTRTKGHKGKHHAHGPENECYFVW